MEWIKQNKGFLVLISFSVIWVIGAIWLLFSELSRENFYPNNMSLNELGDYLAGAFSPLAFLWLVYGYFMQNNELKLSRRSLDEQIKEFKKSVDTQEKTFKLNKNLEDDREKRRAFLAKINLTFSNLSYTENHDPSVNTDYSPSDWNTVSFSIKNWGKDITRVSFKLLNEKREFIQERELPKISEGETIGVYFSNEIIPRKTFLKLELYDTLGILKYLEYELEAYYDPDEGPMKFSEHQWDENYVFNLSCKHVN